MAEGVVHLNGVKLSGVVLQHFFSGRFGRVELRFPGRISPSRSSLSKPIPGLQRSPESKKSEYSRVGGNRFG